jgi:hypothetical protein
MLTRPIARIFDLQLKKVRQSFTHSDAIWKGHGEHRRLDDDIPMTLLEEITKNIQSRASVNEGEVLYRCGKPLGAPLGERWVDAFLSLRKSELFLTISRCQQNLRLEIPRSFLDMVTKCVRQYLPTCCVELIFTFDEAGILASENRVWRKSIGEISMSHQTIHHGVHCNPKNR